MGHELPTAHPRQFLACAWLGYEDPPIRRAEEPQSALLKRGYIRTAIAAIKVETRSSKYKTRGINNLQGQYLNCEPHLLPNPKLQKCRTPGLAKFGT